MPASASIEVRLADSNEFQHFLSTVGELVDELETDLEEPFTMTPDTQDRLRARLDAVRAAVPRLRVAGVGEDPPTPG